MNFRHTLPFSTSLWPSVSTYPCNSLDYTLRPLSDITLEMGFERAVSMAHREVWHDFIRQGAIDSDGLVEAQDILVVLEDDVMSSMER